MDRGFFLIYIYIYILGWVGGFLTLYSVAVKQCTLRWAWAAKRLFCLLWQTSTYTGSPFSNFPPGVQAELISGFHNSKNSKSKWTQYHILLEADLASNTLLSFFFFFFFWWWKFFLRASDPQWRVSLSLIWQTQWCFTRWGFNPSVYFLLQNAHPHWRECSLGLSPPLPLISPSH